MHRTNGDSFGLAPSALGPDVPVYRDENPGVHLATQGRHQEMNALQEEIANVIEAESIVLHTDSETPAQMIQLNTAIENKLKGSRITNDSLVVGASVSNALNTLDGDIASEAGARAYQDGVLATAISTEEGLRIAGDNALQGYINTNTSNIGTLTGLMNLVNGDKPELTGTFKMQGFASDIDVNFYAQIHRHRADGNSFNLFEVIIRIPRTTGVSTSAGLIFSAASVPEALRPVAMQFIPCVVIDNDEAISGFLVTNQEDAPSQEWRFYKYDRSDFAYGSSEVKGVAAQEIRYILKLVAVP